MKTTADLKPLAAPKTSADLNDLVPTGILVAGLMLMVLGLGLTLEVEASPSPSSISGAVYTSEGMLVGEGLRVSLVDSISVSTAYDTTTDANGEYVFTSVFPGDYKVFVLPPSGSPYLATRYPNVVCSTINPDCRLYGGQDIPVPQTGAVTDIDVTLQTGAVIEGQITDAMTGFPLAGIEVGAFAYEPFFSSSPDMLRTAISGPDGSYRIIGLPASGNGGHYVWTTPAQNPVYASTAYPSTPCAGLFCTPEEGNKVPVSLGGTSSGIELQLLPFGSCGTNPSLCLGNAGRFKVDVDWRSDESVGTGSPRGLTTDSGYFWFFEPNNVELIVKVLDGCAINQHFWVFASGLTDVEVDLSITDSETGATWIRDNPLGNPFPPINDVEAFPCSP